MNQVHHWLVKQGRLGLSTDSERVLIEVEPEGADACVLTPRDAFEIAKLLTHHARALWEAGPQSSEYTPSLQTLSEWAYRWQTEAGALTVSGHPDQPEVVIGYTGNTPCRLTVGQAVEVIQIIERLLAQLERRQ
jgi:RimJ/RimL family protein N-acetyltransferase